MSIEVESAEDEKRTHIHRLWAAVAGSWAEHVEYTDARSAHEAELMLDLAAPGPGERVLELACGAGGLGLAAAERVGRTGEVVLSDVAIEMTSIAAGRAAERGLTNTRTRVLDLEGIAEPDRAFDVVLCRDGLQFTVEPARALAEIARVLRPGGRVALAVWGPRADNPWLGVVLDAASAELGRPMPPPGMPGPFALSDRHVLTRLLHEAAFADVTVSGVPVPLHAASFDEWWTRTSELTGPLSAILAGLEPAAAASLRLRAARAVAPFTTSAGVSFGGVALIAGATR
jgi:ubiquinone/menaquinone biosynthesis C-methylase UbiE